MIDAQNGVGGNPFEDSLEHESIPRLVSPKDTFIKIPIFIACTVIVFILIVAGTATTAISYPPEPSAPTDHEDPIPGRSGRELGPTKEQMMGPRRTALDGDYKLLGPLLIMAGGFLLIVDVVLCVIVTKEAYYSSKGVPSSNERPMSILGGPYFLAVPSSAGTPVVAPFSFARHLWSLPNAPLPDFVVDGGPMKGSRVRPSTAVLNQPPFNPDISTPCPTAD